LKSGITEEYTGGTSSKYSDFTESDGRLGTNVAGHFLMFVQIANLFSIRRFLHAPVLHDFQLREANRGFGFGGVKNEGLHAG